VSNARSRLAAYGRTPKALLRDPGIRPIAKTVYTMVDEVAGHEDITVERMAEWLGVNVKTARRALHEIEQAGWVEVVTVVQGQRGQRPSEYVANAYPFQHLSEGSEEVSSAQAADQRKHSAALPLFSTPQEKSGTPPYQKVPSTPVEQTGVPKSGTPRDYQKVGGPTYLRDDETVTTPAVTKSDGFKEFWAAFPDAGYKGRKEECRRIWLDLPREERHAAYRMLMAYKNSVLWTDTERISTPFNWLNNEPWLGDIPQQIKVRKMFSADDVALSD
jgi:hypothetical protein